jgi:hypothetical protein
MFNYNPEFNIFFIISSFFQGRFTLPFLSVWQNNRLYNRKVFLNSKIAYKLVIYYQLETGELDLNKTIGGILRRFKEQVYEIHIFHR